MGQGGGPHHKDEAKVVGEGPLESIGVVDEGVVTAAFLRTKSKMSMQIHGRQYEAGKQGDQLTAWLTVIRTVLMRESTGVPFIVANFFDHSTMPVLVKTRKQSSISCGEFWMIR